MILTSSHTESPFLVGAGPCVCRGNFRDQYICMYVSETKRPLLIYCHRTKICGAIVMLYYHADSHDSNGHEVKT